MITDLDRRAPDNLRVGQELHVHFAVWLEAQCLLVAPAVVWIQVNRGREGGVYDARRLVSELLERLPDLMDVPGAVMFDQQPKEVFGLGLKFGSKKLRQLHPALDAHRRVLKGGDEDVVLEQLVQLRQLGPPGVDRLLLQGQLKNAAGVPSGNVADVRHGSRPPRWRARSARDASSRRGSRRLSDPRLTRPGRQPASANPGPPSRVPGGSRRGPSRLAPRPARAPSPPALCAGLQPAWQSDRGSPAPLAAFPRASPGALSRPLPAPASPSALPRRLARSASDVRSGSLRAAPTRTDTGRPTRRERSTAARSASR